MWEGENRKQFAVKVTVGIALALAGTLDRCHLDRWVSLLLTSGVGPLFAEREGRGPCASMVLQQMNFSRGSIPC